MIKEYEIMKNYYLNGADSTDKKILIKYGIDKHFSLNELKRLFDSKTIFELYSTYNQIDFNLRSKIEELKAQITNPEIKDEFVRAMKIKNCNINVLELIANAKTHSEALALKKGFQYGIGDTEESYQNKGYPTFNIAFLTKEVTSLPESVILVKSKNYKYIIVRNKQYQKIK